MKYITTKKAFTLLELLLVIAIIAVLAGLIVFNLRPAEVLDNTNNSKDKVNANDIEKALETFMLDNQGTLPTGLQILNNYGLYDICKQGETNGCINIDQLVPQYLASIPENSNNTSTTSTGFKIEYDPTTTTLTILPNEEYLEYVNSEATLLKDIISYWKLDEVSWSGDSGEVVDSIGSNNGTSSTATITQNSKYDRAGDFNGSSNYISVGNAASLNFTDSITVSTWMDPNNLSGNKAIITRQDGVQNWTLWFSGNQMKWRLYTSGTGNGVDLTCSNPVYALPTGAEWVHVVGVWDGANSKIFVNGEECATQVVTGSLATGANITIGRDNGSTYMHGRIDDIRIYSRALNSEELNALYLWGPGPKVYYSFDESMGAPTVVDSSTNGGNGTMGGTMNNTNWVSGKVSNALNFSGDDFVVTTNINTIAGQRHVTITMWVNMRSLANGNDLYSECMTTCTNRFQFGFNSSNRLRLGGRHDDGIPFQNYVTDNRDFPTNEWVHVAVVYDASTDNHTIYQNGVGFTQSLASGNFDSGTHATQFPKIGSNNQGTSGFIDGVIDEFRLYYYVLNQDQVVKDMNDQ